VCVSVCVCVCVCVIIYLYISLYIYVYIYYIKGVGVKLDKKGAIIVDEGFQTSVPNIYAGVLA
jgi:hypothetical protein